jgi:D-xylose transport system permease protein
MRWERVERETNDFMELNKVLIPREVTLLGALVVLAGCLAAATGGALLDPRNVSQLLVEVPVNAVLAVGMLLVILTGHIDLAAGSGVGLTGGIMAVLATRHGVAPGLAACFAIAVAIILWWGMGWLVVRQRVPAFIVTLGGLQALKGLFWVVIENRTVPVAPGGVQNVVSGLTTSYLGTATGWAVWGLVVGLSAVMVWRRRVRRAGLGLVNEEAEPVFLRWFLGVQASALVVVVCNGYRGIPLPMVVLCGLALGVHLLLRHTVLGRYMVAVGGNEHAARLSGVPVGAVTLFAFAAAGAVVGLTGLMQTAYAGYSTADIGTLMELDAVAACVMGGVSLRGGSGTVTGVLLGAAIMGVLAKGLSLMGVGPELKYMVRGGVLVLAVWLDVRSGGAARMA